MESCLLVCRKKKPAERKGKIIFIDAKDEIKIERSDAYLEEKHIQRIANAYHNFQDIDGFAKVINKDEVLSENNGNLSISLYVKTALEYDEQHNIQKLIEEIKESQTTLNVSIEKVFN